MATTNMENDDGRALTLQDALCMVSLIDELMVDCCVFLCFFFLETELFYEWDRRTPIDWRLTLTISFLLSSFFVRICQSPGSPNGPRA